MRTGTGCAQTEGSLLATHTVIATASTARCLGSGTSLANLGSALWCYLNNMPFNIPTTVLIC